MSTYQVKIKAAYRRSGHPINVNETYNFIDLYAASAFAMGYAEALSLTIDLIHEDKIWYDIHGNKAIWIEQKIEV